MKDIKFVREPESHRLIISIEGVDDSDADILSKMLLTLASATTKVEDFGENTELVPENTSINIDIPTQLANSATDNDNPDVSKSKKVMSEEIPAVKRTEKALPDTKDNNRVILVSIPYDLKDEAKSVSNRGIFWCGSKHSWAVKATNKAAIDLLKKWNSSLQFSEEMTIE